MNENLSQELVPVDPKEYGLTEETATELTSNLPQIIKERDVLVIEYNEILTMDIEAPETSKKSQRV